MVWVFGWGGGKTLLEQSYAEAKTRAEKQKTRRADDQAAEAGIS